MRLIYRPFYRVSPRAARRAGFTLIELMIGLALGAAVAVGLTQVFRGGLRVWKTSVQETALDEEGRLVLDRIARQYRNALDVPGVAWPKDQDAIAFASQEESGIRKWVYQLAPGADLCGVWPPSVPRTVLRCLQENLSPDGLPERRESTVTDQPTAFTWEYAQASSGGGVDWRSDWKPVDGKSLPCGLRLHLTLFDLQGEPHRFTRVVFSPVSGGLKWRP